MTYQVLARKWRPRTFTELVGQEHVVRALVNGLDNDRIHHAFLFTGTRGVGKTTIARIFAKALNCEQGVSSTPCGECIACQEIDAGRFVDLIEVDAASRTKVDDTRELLENVQYAPTRGRYKVYLIDEVHMLSTHSFNALLKTLEEPPPHVKFLLATTDPQKLPVTILSRCLQFNLKRLPASMIADYLTRLLGEENVPADAEGVDLIARSADGSMRDALSLLDQAIGYGGGKIAVDEVGAMLGTVERGRLVSLLEAVIERDADTLWSEIGELEQYTPDFDALLRELAEFLHRVTVQQFVAGANDEGADADAVGRIAERLSPQDVQLFYQIVVHGRQDLELAPDPRSGFEMTLLRLLAFQPDTGVAPSGGSESGQKRPAPTDPAPVSDPGTKAAPSPEPPVTTVSPPNEPTPSPEPTTTEEPPIAVAVDQSPPTSAEEPDGWEHLIGRLGLKGTAAVLASNSTLERMEAGCYRLVLSRQHEHLHTAQAEEKIREALGHFYGKGVRVRFEFGDPNGETPAARQNRENDERLEAARQSIENDPVARELQVAFGAEVIPDSVRPSDTEH